MRVNICVSFIMGSNIFIQFACETIFIGTRVKMKSEIVRHMLCISGKNGETCSTIMVEIENLFC